MSGRHFYREVAHDRGDNDRCFLDRESRTNTDPRPYAEGNISKAIDRMARPAEEAVRIEIIRSFPQRTVTVKHVRRDDDHRPALDRLAGELIRTFRRTADGCNGRIKAIGLVNHGARFDKTVGDPIERPGEDTICLGADSLTPSVGLR